MIQKLILLIFLPLNFSHGSTEKRLLDAIDSSLYNPAESGLKDLQFQLRISGLEDSLQKNPALGIIKDPYFECNWVTPGRWKIFIKGLPKGFDELKAKLISHVEGRLSFVIPQSISKQVRPFKLSMINQKGQQIIKATDPTQSLPIYEFLIFVDNKNELEKIVSKGPAGTETTSFKMKKTSWSSGKSVIQEISVNSYYGVQKQLLNYSIERKQVAEFYLPEKIEIKSEVIITSLPEGEDQKNKQISNTYLAFSNYSVNQGKALKSMGLKR